MMEIDDGYTYAIFRSNSHDGYYSEYSTSDPYDDEVVKSYDGLLHRTLSKILGERCITGQMEKLNLLTSEHTDRDSVIKTILELEPTLSGIFPDGDKPSLLWISVLLCYQDSAELLVRSGADVNERCGTELDGFLDEKWTILHMMLWMYPSSWNKRFIGLLVEHGADLNARDSFGCTVLHYAVRERRVEVAKIFLEKGIDVNAAANDGSTPLLTAIRDNFLDEPTLQWLLDHGADVTVRDTEGKNALHHLAYASASSHAYYLGLILIKKGASLDDRIASNQYQPLHVAVREGNINLVELFLRQGANVNARAEDGVFPLYLAAEYTESTKIDNFNMFAPLLERGADVEMKTIKGRTALHIACCKFELWSISILVHFGADICPEDNDGKTPYALMNELDHSNPDINLMLKLLAKKKARLQQPSIEWKDERCIKEHPEQWDFYQDCAEQLRKAKSTKLIGSCTFFDLLMQCQCVTSKLMWDGEFETKFKQHDLSVFSEYTQDLNASIDFARIYYREMLEEEDKLKEAFYNNLPHKIVRKVAWYMLDCKECEIRNMVHASRGCSEIHL